MEATIKPAFVAVDTNVLMDQADENENVLDALDAIRGKLKNAAFISMDAEGISLAHPRAYW